VSRVADDDADEKLVTAAMDRHLLAALKLLPPSGEPQAGDVLPSLPNVQAQWHVQRAMILGMLDVGLAAQQLREEALDALKGGDAQ
jgi:hypothetical protein